MKSVFIILLIALLVYAGDDDRIMQNKKVLLQFLPVEAQTAVGFSNMLTSGADEIAFANPASLDNFSSLAAGIEFSWQSTVVNHIMEDLTIKRLRAKTYLPSSFAVVYPVKNWRFALSYGQKYSNKIDYGKLQVTTIENPDGGETVDMWSESLIYSPSALVSYTFNGIFSKNDAISLGGQLNWNYWEDFFSSAHETKLDASEFNWKAGLIYRMNEAFGLGVSYESPLNLIGKFNDLYTLNSKTKFLLPAKLSFGMELKSAMSLTFAGTAALCYWHDVSGELGNSLNLSFNVIYDFSIPLKISLGFYQQSRYIDSYFSYYSNTDYNALLDLGIMYSISSFDLRLEILDSRLASGDSWGSSKYTLIKAGISYSL